MSNLLSVLDTHLQEMALANEFARLNRIRRAWEAYHGHFRKPLKVKLGQPDDNVVVNFARWEAG